MNVTDKGPSEPYLVVTYSNEWVAHYKIQNYVDIDPLYILSVNDVTGRLEGSVRRLPTTGPNTLRDVFPVLLPDGLVVESPIIWESSRFCVEPDAARLGEGRIHRVTTEPLCGLVEVGLRAGLSHIVSVYDARMARIFKASTCPAEVIGTPTRIGRVMTYAGLFEISEALLKNIAAAQSARDTEPSVDHEALRVA